MGSMDRGIERSGILDRLMPAKQLQMQQATEQVIDPAGRVRRDAIAPELPSDVMSWGPGDTRAWPVAQSGRAVMLRAYATTAPTTGPCVITCTVVSELAGEEVVGTVTIPQGKQFAAQALAYDLPGPGALDNSGVWISAAVGPANGASGVSIGLTVRV